MGTCYSKAGSEARSTDFKNRPKKKLKGSIKNGQIKDCPKLTVEIDVVQTDVSDTVYTEDSHTINALDVDNCINRSQQTSLDHLLMKDNLNKNVEVTGECSEDPQEVSVAINTEAVSSAKTEKDVADDEFVHISASIGDNDSISKQAQTIASDSGVEMEHQDLSEERSNILSDKYSADFDSNMTVQETKAIPGSDIDLVNSSELLKNNSESCVCSCHKTCRHGSIKDNSNNTCVQNGECQDELLKSEGIFKRNSETFVLKSSLKSRGTKSRAKKGLSWKSADSLDWSGSLGTSMDRTKSVCSSILGDNLSLLNAPLAAFASSDFALGSSYDFSKRLRENLQANNDCSTDSLQFQFDFSGLDESRQSVASIDSDSCKISDSSTDLEKIKHAITSTPTHRPGATSEANYDLPAVSLQQPEVMRMNMNGRDVVVLDADLFLQIIDEVQLLKMKLTHLTQIIQESDDTEVFVPDNLESSILSSSA